MMMTAMAACRSVSAARAHMLPAARALAASYSTQRATEAPGPGPGPRTRSMDQAAASGEAASADAGAPVRSPDAPADPAELQNNRGSDPDEVLRSSAWQAQQAMSSRCVCWRGVVWCGGCGSGGCVGTPHTGVRAMRGARQRQAAHCVCSPGAPPPAHTTRNGVARCHCTTRARPCTHTHTHTHTHAHTHTHTHTRWQHAAATASSATTSRSRARTCCSRRRTSRAA
jgi:hypothetical protein